jgi:flagellar protein FlaG
MIERLSSQHTSLTPRVTNMSEQNYENTKTDKTASLAVSTQQPKADKEEKVSEVIESMNKFMQASHTSLKFELHEELNEYYVTLVDDVTQEVVREIPSKKLLDVYAAMTEFLGLMVDKKI